MRVTRDVTPQDLRDLVDHPPRATVAFVSDNAVDVMPVRCRCSAGVYWFGLPPVASPDLDNCEVVLVIDAGPYWFELRGISVRGVAKRINPPQDDQAVLSWYAIEARRVLAWDYGAIREE